MNEPMNDLPRQKLCELIATYGRSLCNEPGRCEALLRDFCGANKREINVLVSALRERVATDILGSQDGAPREIVIAGLTKRLQDNLGLAEDASRWAVESWGLALGVISSTRQEVSKTSNVPERKISKESKQKSIKKDKSITSRRASDGHRKPTKTPPDRMQPNAWGVVVADGDRVQVANGEKKQEAAKKIENDESLKPSVSSSNAGWIILAVVIAIVLWARYMNQPGKPQRPPPTVPVPMSQPTPTSRPNDGPYVPPAPLLGPNTFTPPPSVIGPHASTPPPPAIGSSAGERPDSPPNAQLHR